MIEHGFFVCPCTPGLAATLRFLAPRAFLEELASCMLFFSPADLHLHRGPAAADERFHPPAGSGMRRRVLPDAQTRVLLP